MGCLQKKTFGLKETIAGRVNLLSGKKSYSCAECGSEHVVKNGTYPAVNWLIPFLMSLFPFLSFNHKTQIQRLLCKDCDSPVVSPSRANNTLTRAAMKLIRGKLICLLRYKCGMSIRNIAFVVESAFNHSCSTGYVSTLCKKVNIKAKEKMALLNQYASAPLMCIFDETFPKTKESATTQLVVNICENGLIRFVSAVNGKEALYNALKSVLTTLNPLYFMSDYAKLYAMYLKDNYSHIFHCKDFVHAMRNIYRDERTCINGITVKTNGKLTKKRIKEINHLKKRLLKKRLTPILKKIAQGFNKSYAQVGTIYIEGALCELEGLAQQFPSLQPFHKKVAKFINKHLDTWAYQMELGFKYGLPTTSNGVESTNSLFKTFRNVSKCFETDENMDEFFNAVALMENYSIKTRGNNKGTSAMMRAGVDLVKLGGNDFFEVIGLEDIVLGKHIMSSPAFDLHEFKRHVKAMVA